MPLEATEPVRPLRSLSKDGDASVEPFHELRVRIPSDIHRQLLALKILRGVTLAQTVVIALDRYFETRSVPLPSELVLVAKGQ